VVKVIARARLLVFMASCLFGQAPAVGPAFDVESVKPAIPGQTGGRMQFLPGGRFTATNVPLDYMIQQLYEVRAFQVVGDPNWMAVIADGYSARYEIQAKGTDSATEAQVREMVKTLLAERFQLKVHRETRDLPVYALVPARGGAKLAVAKDSGRPRGTGGILSMDKGWIQGTNIAMASFIQALSRSLDRPVVDKTNFTESFDFRLTWTPDSGASPEPGTGSVGSCPASFAPLQARLGLKPEEWDCPSIFTAVQEQMGLRLDPQKDPVEVLVIDHVERPSAN
jgi:uncharacterized protein (TIGR03435 family)